MMEKIYQASSESEMQLLGKALVDCILEPLVVFIHGHLGAGKTTIIRAILKQMGVEGPIQSPSFAIVESYALPKQEILHIDLYRVVSVAELHALDLLDFDLSKTYVFVEWPEHGMAQFLKPDIEMGIQIRDNDNRQVAIKSVTEKGKSVLACLNY